MNDEFDFKPSSELGELLTEDYLEHYGKKGMQWGVRTEGSGSTTRNHIAKIKAKTAPPNPTKHMSNKQIQSAIDRMKLEKQFSELKNSTSKSAVKSGKEWTADVLKTQGKMAAGIVVAAIVGQYARKHWPMPLPPVKDIVKAVV